MLKIVFAPNEVLITPAKPIEKIDLSIKKLAKEMEEVLMAQVDLIGVGLAAPQVGIGLSLFIIKPTAKSSIKAFVNPKILNFKFHPDSIGTNFKLNPKSKTTKKHKTKLEGCFSIPKIWSPVKRAKKVLLEYQNLDGEKKSQWFSGFEAVIIQHEIDHLNGILFTQRALEQKSQLYEEKEGKLEKLQY